MTWQYQPCGHLERRFLQLIELAPMSKMLVIRKRFGRALRKQHKLVRENSHLDLETWARRLAFLQTVDQYLYTKTRSEFNLQRDNEKLLNSIS